ncbi:hypothetical protein EDB80DRAFT_181841 [Ilyonectria destructans]|nr:hypothetical protein EDB80DRAFT_181841 [Ilyonectria destructans]
MTLLGLRLHVTDVAFAEGEESVWTSLVGFLVHSHDEHALEEMGLKLNEDQIDDVLDVMQEVWSVKLGDVGRVEGALGGVWTPIQQLLTRLWRKSG